MPRKQGATKWVEVFRTGTHTGMNGYASEYDIPDLKELADAVNGSLAQNHRVPLVLGHPQDNHPAYGWVDAVKAQAGKLYARFRDIKDELKQAIDAKAYQSVSVALYGREHPNNPTPGRLNLRHIGALGAMQPAVKGMAAVELSELAIEQFSAPADDLLVFDYKEPPAQPTTKDYAEFVQNALPGILSVFQSQRDRLIESDGVEVANSVFSPELMQDMQRLAGETDRIYLTLEDLEMLQSQIADIRGQLLDLETGDLMSEQDTKAPPTPPTQPPSNSDATSSQAPDFSEQLAALRSEMQLMQAQFTEQLAAKDETIKGLTQSYQSLQQRHEEQQQVQERDRVEAFVDKLIEVERKLTPQDKNTTIARLMAMPNESPIQFGEGEAAEAMTPRQILMNELRNRKPLYSDSPMPEAPNDLPPGYISYSETVGMPLTAASATLEQQALKICAEKGWNANDIDKFAEACAIADSGLKDLSYAGAR